MVRRADPRRSEPRDAGAFGGFGRPLVGDRPDEPAHDAHRRGRPRRAGITRKTGLGRDRGDGRLVGTAWSCHGSCRPVPCAAPGPRRLRRLRRLVCCRHRSGVPPEPAGPGDGLVRRRRLRGDRRPSDAFSVPTAKAVALILRVSRNSRPGWSGPYGDWVSTSSPVRMALVAAASSAVLLSAGFWFGRDEASPLRDCGRLGPTGPTPCLYRCEHSTPLGAPPEVESARCVYDPTGEIIRTSTTSATGPPPTTAPQSGQPSTPPPTPVGNDKAR